MNQTQQDKGTGADPSSAAMRPAQEATSNLASPDRGRGQAPDQARGQTQFSDAPCAPEDADPRSGEPGDPGETEAPDPAASSEQMLPPIAPPRSWTKEEKERFRTLPRETQAYLAAREQERDREFRRSQNEQAQARKAIEAERAAALEARAQYEQSLALMLTHLKEAYASEFSDVRTPEDIQRLAHEDPARYSKWDAQQKRIAAVGQEIVQEIAAANERARSEARERFEAFKAREVERFVEAVHSASKTRVNALTELKDEGTRNALMASAEAVLRDVGLSDLELAQHWHGELALSIHDHRFQLILRDAVRWRDAKIAYLALQQRKRPAPRSTAAPDEDAARQHLLTELATSSGMAALRAAAKLTAACSRAG